jgi:hypothetical protein
MGYANSTGYTPQTIEAIIDAFRTNVNAQFGTSYTAESFVGTNHYKYFYAAAQLYQENEVKTSEIFAKLQQYFAILNARISRPVNTPPGIVEKMASEGFVASVKPMIDADAGKVHICVDTDETADDYADVKEEICTLISQITVLGCVTQGTESEAIVLSNGQSFDFKYNLPNRIPVGLRLTVTLSENNQSVVGTPESTKLKLLANIAARYALGKNFEPQKYFNLVDAPWAQTVLLEWTDDVTGGEIDETPTWNDDVYDAAYDDLFEVDLSRVILVEA